MKRKFKSLSLTLVVFAMATIVSAQNVNAPAGQTTNYLTKWTNGGAFTVGNSSIFDNGNIGIGTPAPGFNLDIQGTNPVVAAQINSGGNASAYFFAKDIATNRALVMMMGGSAMAGYLFGQLRLGTAQIYSNNCNLVIGTGGNNDVIFGTNSAANVTIKNGGNVGIGTTTPGTKLEVAGQVKITGGSPGAGKVLTSDANGLASWSSNAPSGGWSTTGNSGTTAGNNFIGTSDAVDFVLKRNNDEGLRLTAGGAIWASGNATTGVTPTSGAGTRMMWIPAKGAFRAGTVNSSNWDENNIGSYSFACGNNTKANGAQAFACGAQTVASSLFSFASGVSSTASGVYSFATGNTTLASGTGASSFGVNTTASGYFSSSFGSNTTAQSYESFVIGQYNTISGNSISWVSTDPLFVIGNGTSTIPSNAMTVLKNGNVGIGSTAPSEKLDMAGNIKMNLNQIFFKDANHGLGYFNTYATKAIDGPVLYGYTGGALGTNQGGAQNVALLWLADGRVGIGSDIITDATNATYKLVVNGKIRAKAIKVEPNWADYVFEKNYTLSTLEEVEQYIKTNGHLPEIPSAKEIESNGADVGEILKLQMQKIEELTLYIIQMQKEINDIKKR